MARETKNEDRKQRIRDAFQEGQAVERMPAREDMQPQNSEDVELRVAPYCRVSTMSEMQAESFEIQQQYYSECIAKHPNWVLVRIYADEGISATSVKNRKEFNQMIEDCQAGKIDMIITKSVSRFARNVVDCIKYARMLRSLSPPVSIYFETENINTLSQNGELLLTVLAAFAQDESVNKSISVAWGIRQRFAKGIPKLVKPYGYQLEDNKLIVDEDEAGVVIRIFAFYLGGKTPYEIAKILTSEGIPSPAGKSHWTVSSVTYILGNDRYCGDIIMQKSICVDLFAHSVDKYYRLARGYNWFEDEQPSDEIKEKVERVLSERDWKIDVVLSHTCPLRYEPAEVFLSMIDQSSVDKSTEQWLGTIESRLHYERWFCGHYHTDKEIDKIRFMFQDYTMLPHQISLSAEKEMIRRMQRQAEIVEALGLMDEAQEEK